MLNMSHRELIAQMRARLAPFNPTVPGGKIVKMGIHSNYGYMEESTITSAIDFFETRSITAFALGEKLNPLETLGALLLLESAHLLDKAK